MNANEGRINSIQALRGIAALSVVAFHLHQVAYKYVNPRAFLPDWLTVGVTGVDLFFVISGFVMVTVTRGRFGRLEEVSRFAWHRATRIYPVYWIYFVLTLAAFVIQPTWVNSSTGHQANNLLTDFFLLPGKHQPFVQVAWSLIHELWFYAVFSLLLLGNERWLPFMLMLWAIVVSAANLNTDVDTLGPDLHIALHPLTFEFLVGAAAALSLNLPAIQNIQPPVLWAVIAGIVVVGLPGVARHEQILEDSDPLRAAVLGPLYACLIAAIALLEQKRRISIPRPLRTLGDSSYTTYLSHLLVIGSVGHIWMKLIRPVNSPKTDLALWPLMTCAVVAYAWLGYRYLEKPLIQLSRWIWERVRSGQRLLAARRCA